MLQKSVLKHAKYTDLDCLEHLYNLSMAFTFCDFYVTVVCKHAANVLIRLQIHGLMWTFAVHISRVEPKTGVSQMVVFPQT